MLFPSVSFITRDPFCIFYLIFITEEIRRMAMKSCMPTPMKPCISLWVTLVPTNALIDRISEKKKGQCNIWFYFIARFCTPGPLAPSAFAFDDQRCFSKMFFWAGDSDLWGNTSFIISFLSHICLLTLIIKNV